MYVLVAEDDQKLGKLITHMLKKEAHTVDWFESGHDVVESVQASAYDAVILDWMMPGEDGVSICRRLREAGYAGGILLLTARDALDDRVCGLDAGADDYLVKPFEFAELLARVRALARRTRTPLVSDTIEAGDFVLHCTEHTLRQNDTVIQLTPREFQLLELLLRNRGQVVPREVILERIWGYDADISSNTLDAFVRLLRKKIDTSGSHMLIQNVRGIGYRLEV